MKAKRVLIVGLGHLGSSLAEELWDTHVEVTVIDKSEAAVEALKDHAAAAFVADGSDPRVLEGLAAGEMDVAVVTFAEDFEACVLAVASLSQLKVPTIIARGANERQAAVLRAVGATRVVLVEHEMGRRLAPEVLSPAASDLVEYASAFRVFPWSVPTALSGKSLAECAFTSRHEIAVLGYWRKVTATAGKRPKPVVPGPDYRVQPGDTLLVIGLHDAVESFLADVGE
jgi:Trk K+ transport system NAD-binding subunit